MSSVIDPIQECQNSNSPYCYVFNEYCKTNTCNQVGYYLCREKGTCPEDTTKKDPLMEVVPNARNASSLVYSICTEMPMMAGCNQCIF